MIGISKKVENAVIGVLASQSELEARIKIREKYNIKINRDDIMRSYRAMKSLTELIRTLYRTRGASSSFYSSSTFTYPVSSVVKVIIDMPL